LGGDGARSDCFKGDPAEGEAKADEDA
jgi:hypothetical protein